MWRRPLVRFTWTCDENVPNLAAKYSSEHLPANQVLSALKALPDVILKILGECACTAYYGNGANLHGALLYVPMSVQTSVLPWFIEDNVAPDSWYGSRGIGTITSSADGNSILVHQKRDVHDLVAKHLKSLYWRGQVPKVATR
jgi:hypothetical protein